ncbi:hypothetical protein ACHWQZ_G001958 [Mnemiopsis leidyi]
MRYGFHDSSIVSKTADDTARDTISDIVDKYQEQNMSQHCSLWDTTNLGLCTCSKSHSIAWPKDPGGTENPNERSVLDWPATEQPFKNISLRPNQSRRKTTIHLVAETHVHVVKQDLKRKVPTLDLSTKYLVAEDCRPLFDHTK